MKLLHFVREPRDGIGQDVTTPIVKSSWLQFGHSVGDFALPLPRFWPPSAIASFLRQLETEMMSLARQVKDARQSQGKTLINDTELKNFKDFFNEFRAWIDGKPSTWWGANVTRGQDYQRRIISWRQLLERKGIAASSPAPEAPGENKLSLPSPGVGMKTILAITAVAAATVGVAIAADRMGVKTIVHRAFPEPSTKSKSHKKSSPNPGRKPAP